MAVTEVVRAWLRRDVSAQTFLEANDEVEHDYLARRPGFNAGSRTLAIDGEGRWHISLRWDSEADRAGSVEAFMTSPATARFVAAVEPSSMSMEQYVEVPPIRSRAAAHVHGLYQDGIGAGRVREAVEEHTGDRYTQHSAGVRDGREGFVEFFEPFIEKHPQRDITLVRTLLDGRYVFVHAAQELDGGAARWVTMDLFEVDGNGRIIEHWDVIAELGGTNPSGHTQVDGATEIVDLHLTERNKDVVRGLLTGGLGEMPTSDLGDFISAQRFVQHTTDATDGLETLQATIAGARASDRTSHYEVVHRLVGQGNFVAALSHVVEAGRDLASFDLFRLEGGLIVEHWDAREPLPSGPDLVNSGKF